MASGPRSWLGPAALTGVAFAVGLATAGGPARALDRRLYRFANRDRGRVTDLAFEGITELGSIWAAAGAAGVLAARGRVREGMDALGAAGAMWLVGQGAKPLCGW